VTDKSGSPVSGATVTVISQGTGAVRETTTDEPGHYTVNPAKHPPTRIVCKRLPAKSFGCLPGFSNLFLGRVQLTLQASRREKNQQVEQERHELQQFVYTLREQGAAAPKESPPKNRRPTGTPAGRRMK